MNKRFFGFSRPDPPSAGGAVDSVNGQTGTVVLDALDVGAQQSVNIGTYSGASEWELAISPFSVGQECYWLDTTEQIVYYMVCKEAHAASGTTPLDDSSKWELTALTRPNQAPSDAAYDATTWNGVTGQAPSKNAVRDQIETMLTSIAGKIAHSLATAANDFLVASGSGTFVKKTLAETVTILRTSLDSVYAAIAAKAPLIFGGHGNGGTIPASTTYYLCPSISGLITAQRSLPIPVAGTIKNLYFRLATNQPASGSLVIEVFGGAAGTTATGVKITIPAGSASATYSDTTHTFSHAAGDLVNITIINNATGASGTIGGVTFELDTALV